MQESLNKDGNADGAASKHLEFVEKANHLVTSGHSMPAIGVCAASVSFPTHHSDSNSPAYGGKRRVMKGLRHE